MKRLFNAVVTAPFLILAASIVAVIFNQPYEGGTERSEKVFLKTSSSPSGEWLPKVADDATPVVQFWHHNHGKFYLLHQSGNVSYVNRDIFRSRTSQ